LIHNTPNFFLISKKVWRFHDQKTLNKMS